MPSKRLGSSTGRTDCRVLAMALARLIEQIVPALDVFEPGDAIEHQPHTAAFQRRFGTRQSWLRRGDARAVNSHVAGSSEAIFETSKSMAFSSA